MIRTCAKREKAFGCPRGISLDRNAKIRIKHLADCALAARQITRSAKAVFDALLWGFHNCKDGRCYPSYETIAERARCCRDTVCEAIKALERLGILSWINRIERIRTAAGVKVIRTSNAYAFRDPLPCHRSRRSESPTRTENPVSITILPALGTSLRGLASSSGVAPGLEAELPFFIDQFEDNFLHVIVAIGQQRALYEPEKRLAAMARRQQRKLTGQRQLPCDQIGYFAVYFDMGGAHDYSPKKKRVIRRPPVQTERTEGLRPPSFYHERGGKINVDLCVNS